MRPLTRISGLTVTLVLLAVSGASAGQFKAVYTKVSDPEFREWQQELMEGQVLESLAADLNGALKIPTDVTLTVAECGTANAFYNPEYRSITICYELIRDFYDIFGEEGAADEDVEESVMNATEFFFYHELGHALIHILDLPTTGMEEDAVDQLSTYVLAYEAEDGEEPALDGAAAFLMWAQEAQASGAEAPVWDEHSLNEQRFFNIVCWVYGKDPGQFQGLVQQGILPESRAARCPGEWAKIDKSWSVLLASSFKGE